MQTVYQRRKETMTRKAYTVWRKEFSRLNSQYLLFCMMAIKIKNAIMVSH